MNVKVFQLVSGSNPRDFKNLGTISLTERPIVEDKVLVDGKLHQVTGVFNFEDGFSISAVPINREEQFGGIVN